MDSKKELREIAKIQKEQLRSVKNVRDQYTNIDGEINTQQATVLSLHELNAQQNVTNLLLHLIAAQNAHIIKHTIGENPLGKKPRKNIGEDINDILRRDERLT